MEVMVFDVAMPAMGKKNDLVDDGISHTSVALNVNEDMFGLFILHF